MQLECPSCKHRFEQDVEPMADATCPLCGLTYTVPPSIAHELGKVGKAMNDAGKSCGCALLLLPLLGVALYVLYTILFQ